eukprot:CAMPEP_0195010122 /NCGR_PEP_ID=MMETSP0326_2-20130528/9851_1 /TAXON_ID=2866 ORGANISM="Crypthecodinium cohnii, Strain Seligo" /NCGR_SAMPLE_ID=MMETSP0326_2 /ASSEMBLY_ACC=CAM_ASM_000348 /LENGTH=66 /DNA_ID=CAMNT_0040018633 /DNA_START=400 /DNA_END=597 /DNA_ORIENTATION=-
MNWSVQLEILGRRNEETERLDEERYQKKNKKGIPDNDTIEVVAQATIMRHTIRVGRRPPALWEEIW